MHCPFCRHPDSRVVDSRTADDGTAIRRRRQCPECGKRFTTAETVTLTVVKRNGVTEPFSRAKVVSGVRKACQGRPVTDDDLSRLAQDVEEAVRATGCSEIASHDVGLTILAGMMWGKPTWGTFWEWGDPRLTSTLLLFLMFVCGCSTALITPARNSTVADSVRRSSW